MTTEAEAKPIASLTQNTPPGATPADASVEAVGADGEAQNESARTGGEASAASTPSPPKPSGEQWPVSARNRVAAQSAKIADYKRQLEAYQRRELASPPVDPVSGQKITQADIDKLVLERAKTLAPQMAEQQVWNARCNEANAAGKSRFKDWDEKVLQQLRPFAESDERLNAGYSTLLAAAIDSGDAPKVLHALGSDLSEAERILKLSPVKIVMEVAKIVGEASDPEPSKAPKPIKPVGTRGQMSAISPDDPEHGHELPIGEWMKRRDADVAAKRRGAS